MTVFALMIFGSHSTQSNQSGLPVSKAYDNAGFTLTADQVSETYTLASIADAVDLPSTSLINENYSAINQLYASTGIVSPGSDTVIEKPATIDISNLSRGIISYEVKDGDTVQSIADAYGLSKDQLRWSNNMKNEDLEVGKTLYIPSVAGIVYTVKDGDTLDSISEKYGSKKEEIIAYNDLENKDISKDDKIILPGGELPEKERPEYVPPTPTPTYPGSSYTYRYVVDSGSRKGMYEVGSYGYWESVYYDTLWQHNPGYFGNCTWYAWYWRRNNMPESFWLPTGAIGHAGQWVANLSGQFNVGNVPAYGAVMQSTSGYYGHVGVVVAVHEGESIEIEEMNWAGPNGQFNHVYHSTLSWGDALNYNYIYGRR